MIHEKDGNVDYLIKSLWVITLFYFIEYPILHNFQINTIVWELGIIVTVIITLRFMRFMDKGYVFPVLLLLCDILCGAILSGIILDVNKIFAMVAFMNALMFVLYSPEIRISRRAFDYIYYVSVILLLIFLVYSFTNLAHKVETDGLIWYCDYFVFNLDNSNTAAMYLYGLMGIILINYKTRSNKLFNIFLIGISIYLIIGTKTRTCLFAAVVAVILYFWFKNRKIPKIIVFGVYLFPIIFVGIYLWLYGSGMENFIIGEKTFFSGRQNVYTSYLANIQTGSQILFGNIGEVTFTNAHNGPLAIFCSTGLVGVLVFYYIHLRTVFRALNEHKLNSVNIISICCILGIIIQTSAEAGMLLGGFPGISFLSTYFVLAFYKEEDNHEYD